MRAYISVADAAECTRRQGQGARGPGCGLGWVRVSSGQTGLRVDATRGAQDWVGCHSRDNSAGKIELIPWLLFIQFHLDSFDRHPAHSLALDPAHILMTSGLPKTGPVLDGMN